MTTRPSKKPTFIVKGVMDPSQDIMDCARLNKDRIALVSFIKDPNPCLFANDSERDFNMDLAKTMLRNVRSKKKEICRKLAIHQKSLRRAYETARGDDQSVLKTCLKRIKVLLSKTKLSHTQESTPREPVKTESCAMSVDPRAGDPL